MESRRPRITILRHGESPHNVTGEESLDPVLTNKGVAQALAVEFDSTRDLILISPMTRTLMTAMCIFCKDIMSHASAVQVWPELRECYDHLICKGSPKGALEKMFPWLDFGRCHDEWDYESHSTERAMMRAENVRMRLKALSHTYRHIVVVTHRAFAAFLVQGPAFETCEYRDFRFAEENEMEGRFAMNIETLEKQDFGPNLLLPAS